jgi:hypothetical protein
MTLGRRHLSTPHLPRACSGLVLPGTRAGSTAGVDLRLTTDSLCASRHVQGVDDINTSLLRRRARHHPLFTLSSIQTTAGMSCSTRAQEAAPRAATHCSQHRPWTRKARPCPDPPNKCTHGRRARPKYMPPCVRGATRTGWSVRDQAMRPLLWCRSVAPALNARHDSCGTGGHTRRIKPMLLPSIFYIRLPSPESCPP